MRTFYHSGDLGDIIYALPTIKSLGGGHFVGTRNVPVRECLSEKRFALIKRLLLAQPYIATASYSEKKPNVGVNLDLFREYWHFNSVWHTSIVDYHARCFGVDVNVSTPWLQVPHAKMHGNVVMARSPRYHSHLFPWAQAVERFPGALFIGLKSEWKAFSNEFGSIEWVQTSDLLEVAEVIAGCRLFIGNQSSPYAVAEGLKVNTIQEVFSEDPNCIFERPNTQYVSGSVVIW